MTCMSPSCFVSRRALTLLELVVVLTILAVLSTVAVRSLEPIADQARYEQTQVVLNDLRLAIAGASNIRGQSSPTFTTGFALDTGALPSNLVDLLTLPAGIVDRTLYTFDSDRDSTHDVTLTSGWNGPYLQLGAGSLSILDGWGAAPQLSVASGDLTISSLGSDGDSLAPEEGYQTDLAVTIQQSEYLSAIVFRLYEIDSLNGSRIDPSPTGTQQLGVLFYSVNATGGTDGSVAEQLIVISNTGSFEYRRASTLVGTTAARAILWDDTNSNDLLDIGETILKKSIVHYPVVTPRMDTRVEMELR